MAGLTETAGRIGREADSSDGLDHAVRAGFVAYGLVHLMIAWLALQLAVGEQAESASSTGALHALAGQPFGQVLICLIAVGMFILVAWRLLEAARGHRDEDGSTRVRKRLGSLGKAAIYASIAVSALKIAIGSDSKGGGSDTMTARLMDLPAGQLVVGAVGLAIVGYGASLVVRAWNDTFAEHLDAQGRSGDSGSTYLLFGKVGYNAKGIAIGIVGGLFVYAAVTHEARKSGGLDQALQTVLEQPFGPYLLGAMAAGIACYGLFCLARARHLSR